MINLFRRVRAAIVRIVRRGLTMLGAAVMLTVRRDMSALRYLALMSRPELIRPAVDFPGFRGHLSTLIPQTQRPQGSRRQDGYAGALDCRTHLCTLRLHCVQWLGFCRSSF